MIVVIWQPWNKHTPSKPGTTAEHELGHGFADAVLACLKVYAELHLEVDPDLTPGHV
jgi:hypothetical protein